MKKYSRLLSIMMIMVMIMTSSLIAVFATNDVNDESQSDALDVEVIEEEGDTAGADEIAAEEAVTSSPMATVVEGKFTITFDAKGGSGEMEAVEIPIPESGEATYELPDCAFTPPTGKVFDKWDKGAVGEEITVKDDTVLEAQWKDAPPSAPASISADTQGKRVLVRWSTVSGATSYKLTVVNGGKTIIDKSVGNTDQCYVSGINAAAATVFTVKAVNEGGESAGKTKNDWHGVRPVAYTCKVKAACKLKSHGGKKQTLKLKKGEIVRAGRFAAGKYIFERNGSTFYMNKTRAKKPGIEYTKAYNYDPQEIELFVNNWGFSSKTSQMVFVSIYTQHLYVFTGKAGNWTIQNGNGFEVSTGKASTPTPTGKFTGSLKIHKKLKTRHGIKYWSCFSSFNAMHGKKKSWKLGSPKSGGCVRNEVANAKWIYNNVAKKSKVVLY